MGPAQIYGDHQRLLETSSQHQTLPEDTEDPLAETIAGRQRLTGITNNQRRPFKTAREPAETTDDQQMRFETTRDQWRSADTNTDYCRLLENSRDQNNPVETAKDY